MTDKNKKLMKYIQLYHELNHAKKNENFWNYKEVYDNKAYFFAKLEGRNRITIPASANFFFRNSGNKFISMLSERSLDFIKNEFTYKAPKKLINFFKEDHLEVKCLKIKTTVKLSKAAMRVLKLNKTDTVLITFYNSGFFIKKLNFPVPFQPTP